MIRPGDTIVTYDGLPGEVLHICGMRSFEKGHWVSATEYYIYTDERTRILLRNQFSIDKRKIAKALRAHPDYVEQGDRHTYRMNVTPRR